MATCAGARVVGQLLLGMHVCVYQLRLDACSIRQYTSAVRQHTSAYVSIRSFSLACTSVSISSGLMPAAYVSIRQPYVSIRQHTQLFLGMHVSVNQRGLDAYARTHI